MSKPIFACPKCGYDSFLIAFELMGEVDLICKSCSYSCDDADLRIHEWKDRENNALITDDNIAPGEFVFRRIRTTKAD